MSGQPVAELADLKQALDGRFPYALLSASLQQRLSRREYDHRAVQHGILRWHPYHRLPDAARASLSEAEYYEAMVSYGGEQLQLYPYVHQKKILFYTRETPLSYYVGMVAALLRSERSYDRLPNFTANDVLRLLGIGRNQYLNTTREVRSKLRWHVNRGYVTDHLPSELLPTVALDPFWVVLPVVEPPAQQPQQLERLARLCRAHPEDAALFRGLVSKGGVNTAGSGGTASDTTTTTSTGSSGTFALSSSFAKAALSDEQLLASASPSMQVDRRVFASDVVYACQLPYDAVHRLYRRALVCADFAVLPEDFIVVPPLGTFVMNRTSDEPLELLLYRVLSTLDDRTPLRILAQLLMVPEEDICAAVHALIRLGLARRKHAAAVPAAIEADAATVHPSWLTAVGPLLSAAAREAEGRLVLEPRCCSGDSPLQEDTSANGGGDGEGGAGRGHRYTAAAAAAAARVARSHTASVAASGDERPPRRIALLYDATLTGFLMMTNLSRDPVFKQLAVTLFEVGKMTDELVGSLLALLEGVSEGDGDGFGGEARKYITSAIALRETLRVLRGICNPDDDKDKDSVGRPCGVDLLKIESLNDLEATTRYSVLGRNYWAIVTTAPIATAPLIDVSMGCVYGSSASLTASPWLLLFLYSRLRRGPPTVLLPFGSQLYCWPPQFHDLQEAPEHHTGSDSLGGPAVAGYAATARVQTITLDAEVSHLDVDSSLLLVSEMAVAAPVMVQCVAPIPILFNDDEDGSGGGGGLHRMVEVAIPFTATAEDTHHLLCRRVHGKLKGSSGSSSRAPSGDAASSTEAPAATLPPPPLTPASTGGVCFEDAASGVHTELVACVAAMGLADSLGYITLCVMYRPLSPAGGDKALTVVHVDVVGIGLGMPLTDGDCCACALRSLPRLLSEEGATRHNDAMRACVGGFSRFLEKYSNLSCATYGKLSLQTAAATGPMTQQHLRAMGGGGAAVPFPSTTILFTGGELQVVDDADPLSEQWSL